jgi:uncharacterized protein (DUF2336 family)
MTELETKIILKAVEARFQPILRELTSRAANDHALLCALVESHPCPLALRDAAHKHVLAQQATALNSAADDRQLDSLIATGERTLEWVDRAVQRALAH